MHYRKIILSFVATIFWLSTALAQQVPYGINYQAVARNSYGEELANRQIDIRFSVRSGTDQGNLEYQEVHAGIVTNPYGVFEIVIGSGTAVGGDKETFSEITWELDDYYLGVEIKFGSDFLNMGTMKFLSVPYALYAGKSLEAGPEGPPGPPGDPATDDQMLSFDGTILTITDGNFVSLESLVNNTTDEIQYLSIQDNSLSITNGNSILLQEINIDDADADPANEIQDLDLTDDMLKITNNVDAHEYDLSAYKDNTDAQTLSFESSTNLLSISNGNTESLAALANTDQQQLSYNSDNYELSLENGGTVTIGSVVAFRATLSTSMAFDNDVYEQLVFDNVTDVNNIPNINFDPVTGSFTAQASGIYSFSVTTVFQISNFHLKVVKGTTDYEKMLGPTSNPGTFNSSFTCKLDAGDEISIWVKQTNGFDLSSLDISGSFSGFRVY